MAEQTDQHRCPWCGYDLRGQSAEAGTCPECGNPYDRRYPRHPEYERQLRGKLHRLDWWLTLLIAVFVFGILLILLLT